MLRATLYDLDESVREELETIPGVWLRQNRDGRGTWLAVSPDAVRIVERLTGATLRSPARPPPPLADASGFAERLTDLQRDGALALARGEVQGLIWGCGAGKTAAAISAALAKHAELVLVVTRAIGREVWPRDGAWAAPGRLFAIVLGRGAPVEPEAAKRHAAMLRAANRRLQNLRARGADVQAVGSVAEALAADAWAVVVGWETLDAHVADLAACTWDAKIADEAHMAKGRQAGRARAAKALGDGWWPLTATPVRNKIDDLHGSLSLVNRSAWGKSSWKFVLRYAHATPGRHGGLELLRYAPAHKDQCERCQAMDVELAGRLRYWFSFATRADYAHKLPAKRRNLIRVPVGGGSVRSEQEIAAGSAERRLGSRALRGIEAAIAHAADTKLCAVVDRCAEALISGEKVVLVGARRAWVPRAAAHIERAVQGVRATREKLWCAWVHGGQPADPAQRRAVCDEFMRQPAPAVLVATSDSVGEALDLNDADRLVVAALPWTGGALVQLEGRVHRLGQSRPVEVDYFIADGTIDEEIEQVLLGKLGAVDAVGADTEGAGGLAQEGLRSFSDVDVAERLSAWLEKRAAAIAGGRLLDASDEEAA